MSTVRRVPLRRPADISDITRLEIGHAKSSRDSQSASSSIRDTRDRMTASTINIAWALQRAVSCWPNGEAIVCDGNTTTWSQVDACVQHLETFLSSAPISLRAGHRLAIIARNSDVYLHYIFAAARLGIVVVGINVQWSNSEVSHALSDSVSCVCVFDQALAPTLERALAAAPCVTCVIQVGGGPAPSWPTVGSFQHPQGGAASTPRGGSARVAECSILYSSGSSGRAKGVVLSHMSHMVQALEKVAQVGYSHQTRYLNCVPLYHVGGVSSALAVTLCGGCHVMMPKFDGGDAARVARGERCNALVAVPTMLEMMLDAGAGHLPLVTTVLVGGQSMSHGLVHRARGMLPRATFIQTFACTEACSSIAFSVISTPEEPLTRAHQVRRGRTPSGETVACLPVGRPAHHAEIAIWSEEEHGEAPEMMPCGIIGRIATRGVHVMMGYANLPSETVAAVSADGWLFTGDVGFIDADGTLCFTSRASDRINTGGEKVFASEVEACLQLHPCVKEAAVFGIDHSTLGQAVAAAVVVSDYVGARELREHCRRGLSGYKVPKHIFHLDEMPYTPSGKIVKQAVRERCLAMMQPRAKL